jgi:hypothetical protein
MQFLNFEDPEDMLKKKDEAILAMQQQQPPVAETAQQVAPTVQPPRSIER